MVRYPNPYDNEERLMQEVSELEAKLEHQTQRAEHFRARIDALALRADWADRLRAALREACAGWEALDNVGRGPDPAIVRLRELAGTPEASAPLAPLHERMSALADELERAGL